ncbi:MAG: hypothetical protein N4R99_05745 [Lactobacillus iners]|nr:hypothetical protein [Lactobacillus iners]
MQKEFHYTIKEILSMSKLDFLVFLDSLTTGENTDSIKTMAIDEAFPEFFLDPNAKNQKKGG